jgi:hypothetical protein
MLFNMVVSRVMCYNNVCRKTYRLFTYSNAYHLKRCFSTTDSDVELMDKMLINVEKTSEKKRSGFAQAFERYTSPPETKTHTPEKEETFASLLRNSKFIDVRILCTSKVCIMYK